MNELIAFSNKLNAFFSTLLRESARLYPEGTSPRRGNRAILVHASLSAAGRIFGDAEGRMPGGADSVLSALLGACRMEGVTLVMPAHSDAESCPAAALRYEAADELPICPEPVVYDRKLTSCRGMGVLAETFRKTRGVRRSAHPCLSFCALGPASGRITRTHRREAGLGPRSPLGRLRNMDALVLMLGTGYDTCTALHLAEYAEAERLRARGGTPETVTCHAGTVRPFGAGIGWNCWEDLAFHPELFAPVGAAFESAFPEKIIAGPPGKETWRLFRLQDIVEFSIDRCGVLE